MHRQLVSLILALIFSSLTIAQEQKPEIQEERRIEVIVGIDKKEKLPFTPDMRNIKIGNETIIAPLTFVPPSEVIFTGMKPGETSVLLWESGNKNRSMNITVNVRATNQSKVVTELRDFFSDIEGIEIGIKGEFVYVSGQLIVPNDVGRVVKVLEKYPDVISFLELSPQTQRVVAEKMQDEIQKTDMKDVTVRIVNGSFWLEGIVSDPSKRDVAQRLAEAYVPDRLESLARQVDAVSKTSKLVIQNFIQVNQKAAPKEGKKIIKITSQFVELSKGYQKIFGFKWDPTITGGGGSIKFGKTSEGGVSTSGEGTLTGVISNLFPKLASAKNAGYARIVQSGMVLAEDGVQASIEKKSSQRFALGSGEFTQGQTAEAGFSLKVTPEVMDQEKIHMNIGMSVSSNIGNPPETVSNTINTALTIKAKESAVVGGVVINKTATGYDRDPPFGKTEIDPKSGTSTLFSFMRSKGYTTDRNQFVVFITPEIIENAAADTEDVRRKFRQRRN